MKILHMKLSTDPFVFLSQTYICRTTDKDLPEQEREEMPGHEKNQLSGHDREIFPKYFVTLSFTNTTIYLYLT